MTIAQQTKDAIMRWRVNNLDKYREYQRHKQKEYYDPIIRTKKYLWKKESKIFMNILL